MLLFYYFTTMPTKRIHVIQYVTCCVTVGWVILYIALCVVLFAESLSITTTLTGDAALQQQQQQRRRVVRCLFGLTPPASRNFNKSLSKTSTFALGLRRVSRGDSARARAVESARPSLVVQRRLQRLLLLRRDEVVLISATPELQLTELPIAHVALYVYERTSEGDRVTPRFQYKTPIRVSSHRKTHVT